MPRTCLPLARTREQFGGTATDGNAMNVMRLKDQRELTGNGGPKLVLASSVHMNGLRQPMMCRNCDPKAKSGPTQDHATTSPGGRGEREVARLRALVCERCGGLLEPADSLDALLHQLETLARFGLTSDGPPLLVSSAEER